MARRRKESINLRTADLFDGRFPETFPQATYSSDPDLTMPATTTYSPDRAPNQQRQIAFES